MLGELRELGCDGLVFGGSGAWLPAALQRRCLDDEEASVSHCPVWGEVVGEIAIPLGDLLTCPQTRLQGLVAPRGRLQGPQ